MKAYMNLYISLREKITDGTYSYGVKIPSKRQLAEDYGVSVITAEHALELLSEEGYVEMRERSGCFVIYREKESYPVGKSRPVVAPERAAVEVREQGESDLFPFSAFAKTMRSVLSMYGERLLSPSPHEGLMELRKALADYLARSRNMKVKPQQIFIGSGAEYLYGLNVQALGREKLYALENPSYEKIRKVYEANMARTDFLTMGPEGIETEELDRTKASVLHVTPFNSYPSGITANASKRAEYIRWAYEREGMIIEDDFDSEFTLLSKPEDTLFSLDPGGRVIYMNSFTKTIAPSLRAAYLVLPENLLDLYEEKVGFYTCTVPVFDQLVLAEFIESGRFERHINRVRRHRRTALKSVELSAKRK